MRHFYTSLLGKRFLLLTIMALLVGALPVCADPVFEDFNKLSSLPDGWWVDGNASTYAVGTDRDYSGREGNAYRCLYTVDGSSNTSDVVVTQKYSGMVYFYVRTYSSKRASGSLTVYEYKKEDGNYVRGSEITSACRTWSNVTAQWELITIDCGTKGKYLGIMLSKACLDNFTAENLVTDESDGEEPGEEDPVVIEVKKALTLVGFERTSDYEAVANEKNEFEASFLIKAKNASNVKLGADELSVSVTNIDGSVVYGTAVAAGDSLDIDSIAEIPLTLTVPAGTGGYVSFYAKENITNTFCLNNWGNKQTASLHVTAWYSEFSILGPDGYKLGTDEVVRFGTNNMTVSQTITIKNTGTAPLVVSEIALPEGFSASKNSFTVAANGQETVDIILTPIEGSYGAKQGEVTITYEGGTFTFTVTGTTVDPSAYFVNFENKQLPDSWQAGTGWNVTSQSGNYYAQQSSTASVGNLITQRLTVGEGETMTIQAKRAYAYTAASLSVFYSATGQDDSWTEAGTWNLTSAFEDYTVSGIPAGDYYLCFQGQYVAIDNILGFHPAGNAPQFAFFDESGKGVKSGTVYDFGMTTVDQTVNYLIKNTGTGVLSATLSVGKNFIVTPASVELLAGQGQTVTVTMPVQPFGEKADTLVVRCEGFDEFKLILSGKSRDPELLFVDFQDKKLPRGWQAEGKWSVSWESFGSDNYWAEHVDYTNTPSSLITEKVKIGPDDALRFDTKRYESYEAKLSVSYSVDRKEWKEVQVMDSQLTSEMTTQTVALPISNEECYLRFEGCNVAIDNITGVHKAEAEEHQVIITKFLAPDTCEINKSASFSVTAKNLWADREEVKAALFVNGEQIGENVTKTILLGTEAVFYFNYTPRQIAEGQKAYILLSYAGGNLQTEEKTFTVKGEVDEQYAHLVNGMVTDSSKQPLEGVGIQLKSKTGDAQYEGTSDAGGKFSIKVVQGLYAYTLTASKEGYQDTTMVISFGGADIDDMEIIMLRVGEVVEDTIESDTTHVEPVPVVADTIAIHSYMLPDSVELNKEYLASVCLYSRKALKANEYKAVLHFGEESIETVTTDVAESDSVLLSFSYRPTAVNTYKVYIEIVAKDTLMQNTPVHQVVVYDPALASVTSIKADTKSEKCYDLQGRSIYMMRKGMLYIRDGKKVLR